MKLRFLLLSVVLLVGCTTTRVSFHPWQPWQVADLRLLDQAKAVPNNNAIIAAYSRIHGDDAQFRVDLLEIQPDNHFDVFLLLKYGSGNRFSILPSGLKDRLGSSICQGWDWLFYIPAGQTPKSYMNGQSQPVMNVIPRLQRDPTQDTLTISLNRNLIKINPGLFFQVFISRPGDKVLLDQTPCISNDISRPIPLAPLVFEFSNTFNAVTPAQALRQWDGAHTGPAGERHGLEHILTNALIYKIPVVLLDLKNPLNLSGLDFIGGMAWIRKLERGGLLFLPDVAFSTLTDKSLSLSRWAAVHDQLQGSQFVFSPDGQIIPGYQFQFQQLSDTHHIFRQESHLIVPLPGPIIDKGDDQVSSDGLSLLVRKSLLATALSPDPSDLVVLGGDLERSHWGDAASTTLGFVYISNHPWIQPLNESALKTLVSVQSKADLTTSVKQQLPSPVYNSAGVMLAPDSMTIINSLQRDLILAKPNPITDSAWSLLLSITRSKSEQNFSDLRAQYLFLVRDLLLASRWAAHPWISSDCSRDLDGDSRVECLVTSMDYFSIFKLEGGTLTLFFIRDGDQVHQVIGPTSQLVVGLSDPSRWNIKAGPFADPLLVPGAFSDLTNPLKSYNVNQVNPGSLELESSDGKESRLFIFNASGISITVRSDKPINQVIPIILDPQNRFLTDWADQYLGRKMKDQFKWSLGNSISVSISSTGELNAIDFTESEPFILKPENPNFDYPPGHFLPFPLARIDIFGSGTVTTMIQIDH